MFLSVCDLSGVHGVGTILKGTVPNSIMTPVLDSHKTLYVNIFFLHLGFLVILSSNLKQVVVMVSILTALNLIISSLFSYLMYDRSQSCLGFEFGKRQTGELVNDIVLPPWCNGNPRQFVLIHRQALESEYVRENISSWLDLVFGVKQGGEEAVKAINVFHPAVCGDSWLKPLCSCIHGNQYEYICLMKWYFITSIKTKLMDKLPFRDCI